VILIARWPLLRVITNKCAAGVRPQRERCSKNRWTGCTHHPTSPSRHCWGTKQANKTNGITLYL